MGGAVRGLGRRARSDGRPILGLIGATVAAVLIGLFVAGRPSERPVAARAAEASAGSLIAVSPVDGRVWVVNPDADSISLIDPVAQRRIAEIPVGREPWSIALSADGATAYVVCRADGALVVVDTRTQVVRARLPIGPEPGQVVLGASGDRAYASITSDDQVAIVDTGRLTVTARVSVDPRPFALAVSADPTRPGGERVFVSHLQALPAAGSSEGRLTVLDALGGRELGRLGLPADDHGFPNLLTGLAVGAGRVWVAVSRAAPALPNDFNSTIFAAIAVVDEQTGTVDPTEQIALNDEAVFGAAVSNPAAVVPTPDGRTVLVVAAGSDLVEVLDMGNRTQPRLVKFLAAGRNPRGLALSADGRWAYVMSYLSRAVTVLDLANLAWSAEIPATGETLEPAVLQGKILFNNAADPRLSKRGWIACAGCHFDGGTDGVTWTFPDGPRQTPALWNAGRTLPWHWSAALDEAADVEDTIQTIQRGLGLAPGVDPPLLGAPNAGRSPDLDALAAYLDRGIRPPAPPSPSPADDLAAGRRLFRQAGCAVCHGGPEWTASHLPGPAGTLDPDGNGQVDTVLRRVGTLNPRDVRGAAGFDPPSLLGVGLTAPYLHDGSRQTLEDLLAGGHPNPSVAGEPSSPLADPPVRLFLPAVAGGARLEPADRNALAAFLRSIGLATRPVGGPE